VLGSISDLILSLPAGAALAIVFLVPALEASAFVGFVFPGEIAVILGGVLASEGRFSLWTAVAAAVLGAVIGDSIGYEVGKRWGDKLLRGTLGHLPIAGRFTAALRVLVPGLAGMAEIRYRTFLLFNALGAVLWGTTFAVLGYFAGAAWHRVAEDASRAGLVLLGLVLLALIGSRALRAGREHGAASADRLAATPPARWFRRRYPRFAAWLARRVDPSSAKGFPLSLALVGAALALWLFGSLTQDVIANDDAALRDPAIASWFLAHRAGWLSDVMRSVTWLGSNVVLIPVVLASGVVFFVVRRTVQPMVQLVTALISAVVLYNLAKPLVDRGRPPMNGWLVRASGPSFPSGHSADAAAVFGMLAVIFIAMARVRLHVLVATGSIVVLVLVAVSRLYLGVVWFTDVVAGFALGWAVVATVGAISLVVGGSARGAGKT
jgi:membrane protein DedA with SNARE-associated domain/membrane-associated phospholipid phosphatase